MGESQSDFR